MKSNKPSKAEKIAWILYDAIERYIEARKSSVAKKKFRFSVDFVRKESGNAHNKSEMKYYDGI